MKGNFERNELRSNLEIPSAVPEFINARIDDTLKNLEQRKRSRKFAKKTVLILVACLTIISFGTLAAFGQSLPILNSLLKFVNPSAANNYESVKVDITGNNGTSANGSGKTAVNKKATDHGITLTVNDLSYDGASLIVGFDLSKSGGFGSNVSEIDSDLLPSFQDPKDVIPSSTKNLVADSYFIKKDNGDYEGYASFYFGDPAANIQDDYTLTLTASNIGLVDGISGFTEVNGLWKIDTGLTEKDIYTAAQITVSNIMHPIYNGKVNSVKIIRSALDNIISLKGTYNTQPKNSQAFQGFYILDDKGNSLNYKYILQDGAFNSVISLMRIPNDTKKLMVIPYTSLKSSEKQYSADITKLPVTIKLQEQEINITDIERSQGKFIMHYTISGLTDNREFTNFEFEDKNGNKINPLGPPTRLNPMNYETGQGTYEFTTDQAEDIAKVIVHGQEYDLQNDYKFDVDLK